jgi:hypothetical protein
MVPPRQRRSGGLRTRVEQPDGPGLPSAMEHRGSLGQVDPGGESACRVGGCPMANADRAKRPYPVARLGTCPVQGTSLVGRSRGAAVPPWARGEAGSRQRLIRWRGRRGAREAAREFHGAEGALRRDRLAGWRQDTGLGRPPQAALRIDIADARVSCSGTPLRGSAFVRPLCGKRIGWSSDWIPVYRAAAK